MNSSEKSSKVLLEKNQPSPTGLELEISISKKIEKKGKIVNN